MDCLGLASQLLLQRDPDLCSQLKAPFHQILTRSGAWPLAQCLTRFLGFQAQLETPFSTNLHKLASAPRSWTRFVTHSA